MLREIFVSVAHCYKAATLHITWTAILQGSIIACVSWFIYSQFLRVYNSPLKYLPSVPFVPLVGSVPEMINLQCGEFGERYMNNLKSSVFRFYWLLGAERVMVCDANVTKTVLLNRNNAYRKSRSEYKFLKSILGDGLVTSEEEIHSRNRKLCNGSFKLSILKNMVPIFDQYGRILIESWHSHLRASEFKNDEGDYTEISIQDELVNLTMDILGKCVFGYEFNALHHSICEVTGNFRKMVKEIKLSWTSALYLIFPFTRLLRNKYINGYDQRIEDTNKLIYSVIERKREQLESTSAGNEVEDNLLTCLLRAKDEDDGSILNDKQLRDEIMTFMLAGHETTNVCMTWFLLQMARFRHIQDTVREEIQSFLPPTGESLTYNHLEKLTYLTCAINETLRILPPAPFVFREVIKDNYIGDYYFPRGTSLMVNIFALHRNPRYWNNPLEFRPERFQDPSKIYSYSFLPFLAGCRMCIGYRFAMIELKTVLALLIKNFEFSPLPGVEYRRVIQLSMKPKPRLVLRIRSINQIK